LGKDRIKRYLRFKNYYIINTITTHQAYINDFSWKSQLFCNQVVMLKKYYINIFFIIYLFYIEIFFIFAASI